MLAYVAEFYRIFRQITYDAAYTYMCRIYAEFLEIRAKICSICKHYVAYAEKYESSHISERVIFEMPKYEEKYVICGFSQNMRYMLRSRDRYKLASLFTGWS